MKTTMKLILAMLLVIAMLFSVVACDDGKAPAESTPAAQEGNTPEGNGKIEATGLWATAKYLEDTTVGEGAKIVLVDIEADGKKITLTVKTDKATLGEALFDLGIINDASFFDVANGITASWSADNAYWGFYQGDEYMMVGVGDATISGGEHYRLVYTK